MVGVGSLEKMPVVAHPGHTADSLSFWVPQESTVLTGDTVLGRGTTVVAHPDGQLGAYLTSLDRLHGLAAEHGIASIWPGHGPVIDNALPAIEYYVAHRQERLQQVEAALGELGAEPDTEGPPGGAPAPDRGEGVRRRGPRALGRAELSVRPQLAYLNAR